MSPGQEIVLDDALRQLRLPAMVREWREHARQAKDPPPHDFLGQ